MRLKRFAFKLKPETTLGQIWEAIREWIEGSPYSRFKGRRMLPTKIADGEAQWEAQDDCVTLSRAGEAMRVTSARTRRGLRWRTDLSFTRLGKCVQGVVEMHIVGSIPEGDVVVKEPIIVKRLRRTYGLPDGAAKTGDRKVVDDLKSHVTAEADRVIGAMKDKGGRPKRSKRDGSYLSQGDIAKMFGPPCTQNTVSNWERFVRTGGKKGSTPPSAKVGDKFVSYRAELRERYTGENCKILAAIIENFKSLQAVKQRVNDGDDDADVTKGGKPRVVHPRNDETLYRLQRPDGKVRTENRKNDC